MRQIYYKRFRNMRLHHFSPAKGYNCPKIPLGSPKGPDYEVVKVVRTEGSCSHLKGRRVLISWGLNLTLKQCARMKQVIAYCDDSGSNTQLAEIVLAC